MNIFTKLAAFFQSSDSGTKEKSSSFKSSLKVSEKLKDFLDNEVLDGLDITPDYFWASFEKIVDEFVPRN